MLNKQSFPVYALNLDRSKDRWDSLLAHAQEVGVAVQRVPAVDGKLLRPEDKKNFDDAGFRRDHGKIASAAEIGCYLSHMKALQIIASGDAVGGVIIEDDIRFSDAFLPAVEAAMALQGWDVIKLIHNRLVGFRPVEQLTADVAIGRTTHGPLGNAGAYIVSKEGAAKLLRALQIMHLPFDVALERGWTGNYNFFTASRAVVSNPNESASTISEGGADSYAKAKLPTYKRITTLFFRVRDYLNRMIYSFKKTDLCRR